MSRVGEKNLVRGEEGCWQQRCPTAGDEVVPFQSQTHQRTSGILTGKEEVALLN